MQRPCGGEEHGTVEKHKGGQCAWNITSIGEGGIEKVGQEQDRTGSQKPW